MRLRYPEKMLPCWSAVCSRFCPGSLGRIRGSQSKFSLVCRKFSGEIKVAQTDSKEHDPLVVSGNFIKSRILADMKADAEHGNKSRLALRFPPDPNGYMHIGHAKSVCINFGLAREMRNTRQVNATCFLRFDDTNPSTASQKYADGIARDVRWLGFKWDGPPRYTSDYFESLYNCAKYLIQKELAYVCDLSQSEAKAGRGVPQIPNSGTNSPYRERSVSENMELFEQMRAGKLADGACVLRAKIDMASPNMHMRDPTLYRIKRDARHFRTGSDWCIFPTYDFAHCLSDVIEGITHSLCTLEFEVRAGRHAVGTCVSV